MKKLLTTITATLLVLHHSSKVHAVTEYVNITEFANNLDSSNPLSNLKIKTIDGFINTVLPYLLTFSGLILFGMLIMGGFDMMTAGTDSKKADAGKTRITQAVVGFVIIFAAYWIAQIVEIILGVNILK